MSDHKTLAFDTALGACSVAVVQRELEGRCTVLASSFEDRNRGHAEVLMPMIERVLEQAGCGYTDLARIGVTVGPGTFTGVRVGIAAARGLALATGLRIVTMSTLEAIAHNVPDTELETSEFEASEFEDSEVRIVSAHDARRGELYVQVFDASRNALAGPQVLPVAQAARVVPEGRAVLVGTGARLLRDAIAGSSGGENTDKSIPRIRLSTASPQPDAAAAGCVLAGREPCDSAPEPLYLRAPDAKLPARMGVERRP